jgi:hypothetical protein
MLRSLSPPPPCRDALSGGAKRSVVLEVPVSSAASRLLNRLGPRRRLLGALWSTAVGVAFLVSAQVANGQSDAPQIFRSEYQALGFGEVLSFRTAGSRTVRNLDGSFTLETFSGPIHYRNGAGQWSPIENTLAPSSLTDYARTTTPNSFSASFKDKLDADFLLVETAQSSYALTLTGSRAVSGIFGAKRVKYAQVYPDVDLVYDLLPGGLKETLFLHGPSAPTTYRFILRHVRGDRVRASLMTDGRLGFRSVRDGRLAFVLEPPVLREQLTGGRSHRLSKREVTMHATEAGSEIAVTLEIDREWLHSPTRRFPVEVDPTLTLQMTSDDATFPDCHMAGDLCVAQRTDRLSIGGGPEDPLQPRSQVFHAALEFDVAAIPARSEITADTARTTGCCSCGTPTRRRRAGRSSPAAASPTM